MNDGRMRSKRMLGARPLTISRAQHFDVALRILEEAVRANTV